MGVIQFDDKDVNLNLDVSTYGNIERISDTLSKCRVRIFYKGMNRNRTYISDDFAQQLIDSLPYAPIKGIFSFVNEDFEDHGEDYTDGRIYGIVPEQINFAWEKHLDNDNIEREYATCDVYLFTGLYPEAKLIPGKPQSMEIFSKTCKGEWKISQEDGLPYFLFTSGSLVGLQTLGTEVEPCFEGAAFFSLYKEFKNCLKYIDIKEEKNKMDKTIFRLSDNEKWEALFDALNPNFNEEGNWECNCRIISVYDDYALCYDCDSRKNKRVYYTKTDDAVIIGEILDVFIVDVTETEYNALEAMKSIGGTYEAAQEAYTNLETQKNEAETKVGEFEKQISELETAQTNYTTEKEQLENKITEFETTINEANEKITEFEKQISELNAEKIRLENEKNDIISEKEELATFKLNVETEKKTAIIDEFANYLTDEQIDIYKADIDKYTISDFKKEICMAAYEANPTIFSNKEQGLIFTGANSDKNESGVMRILNKYKSGGNK